MADQKPFLKKDVAALEANSDSSRETTVVSPPEDPSERLGLLRNSESLPDSVREASSSCSTRDPSSSVAGDQAPTRCRLSCCLTSTVAGMVGVASAVAASALLHRGPGDRLVPEVVRNSIIGVPVVEPARRTAWLPAKRPRMPPKRSDMCNITAPIPRPRPPRSWQVGPGWKRACELKTRSKDSFVERNWCWIGVKEGCHSYLKAHHPWAVLQNMAASWGDAPPRSVEPFDPLENPSICDDPNKGRTRRWTAQESAEAREWFRNHVAVYVLGLFSDMERWKEISERLHDLRIWATHIPGVDMRNPGAMELAKADGWIPQEFNFSHAQAVAYRPEHNMGPILGTLGCASAHFKAQTKVMADGLPLAVVFEDDSWPTEDFVERLWSLVREELPCDWEVTALYSRCPYGLCVSSHLSRVQPDGNEPDWRCRHGVNWGMQAVLYRTEVLPRVQKLWKRTVFDEQRPHCMDVDVALASISDKVGFYAVPAVQDPGFLKETNHPSLRWNINVHTVMKKGVHHR
mmetsp:Transcript_144259/g.402049  ORF Transcript_144259/g.402049 Transcript_144259/m.402049 type:complete len:517 (-) Transcript_144259:186-1736(-)